MNVNLHKFFSGTLIVTLLMTTFLPLSYAKDKKKIDVSGFLKNSYILRSSNGPDDHDIETLLSLNIGNTYYDKFSFAIEGGGLFDLNGDKNDPYFSDINNTFHQSAVGRLYYGYVNVRDIGIVDNIRVGRQNLYRLENYYFDGASLMTVPLAGFVITAYGGAPVHLYENQIGQDPGDWLTGGSLQWNPVSRIRLRLDYTHSRDKTTGFRVSQGHLDDDLMGASVWISLSQNIDLYSKFTSFANEVRDVEAASTFRFPSKKITIRLSVFRLLEIYDIRVFEWDTYSTVGSYRPYTQISFNMTKLFGEHFSIDGGVVARILDANQQGSAFNHGYERGFLSFGTYDFLAKGLDMNVTADYYHGEDNTLKDNSFGGSFEVSKRIVKESLKDREIKFGVGTAYYLYKYNLLDGNESDDVQTYFANIEGNIVKNFKAKIAYEFEDNDFDNYHEAKASLIWSY